MGVLFIIYYCRKCVIIAVIKTVVSWWYNDFCFLYQGCTSDLRIQQYVNKEVIFLGINLPYQYRYILDYKMTTSFLL